MSTRHLIFLFPILLLIGCQTSVTEKAIKQQLQDYPESRVLDIYKSFCQDNLGPGHLIPNPEYARNYLEEEVRTYRKDLDDHLYEMPSRRYYPVGDQGNYVRVDLSVVLDSLVSSDVLLDALVRSANSGKKLSNEEWIAKWNEVKDIILKDFKTIPDAGKDIKTIDSLIAGGNLIMHHSEVFSKTYNPHYRIIAKDIFEEEFSQI